MNRVRKLAVTASTLLALGSTALVFSGPASASTGNFCNLDGNTPRATLCAEDTGIPYFLNMVPTGVTISSYVWHPNDATTEIREEGGTDCMQIVPSSNPPNGVRMANCDGGADQTFIPTAAAGGGFWFKSELSGNLCLNDHWQIGTLNATSCSDGGYDQVFS